MRLIVCSLLWVLAGCSNEYLADGYQLGDLTLTAADSAHRISAAVDQYCSETADSAARQAALLLIRSAYPLVPANGICIGQLQEVR